MKRARVNVYIDRDYARRIAELAQLKRRSKSSIIAAALAVFLSPEEADKPIINMARRLDRVARQMDRIERHQVIALETLALFIRHELSLAIPVAEANQSALRTQGRARFNHFVEQLTQHLQVGGSLAQKIYDDIGLAEHGGPAEQPPVDST